MAHALQRPCQSFPGVDSLDFQALGRARQARQFARCCTAFQNETTDETIDTISEFEQTAPDRPHDDRGDHVQTLIQAVRRPAGRPAKVKAPSKQLVWFENSAHEIFNEEPGKTLVSLVRHVRPFAEKAGDAAP
jgi:hypothetical protein